MQALFEEDGIPLVVLNNRRRITRPIGWMLSVIRGVVELRRVFVEFAPDIINVHLQGPELDTLLAARLAAIDCVVVTIHSPFPVFCSQYLSDRVRQLRLRSLYPRFRAAIADSDEVRKWSVRQGIARPNRVFVVHNGVDLSKVVDRKHRESLRVKKGIPGESFVFASVAMLRPVKGYPVLLEAIAQMPQWARNASVFLLIGDGPERQRLEAQALASAVQESVRFLGVRYDVPELLALSDVYVVPSHREGLSLALIEAMATGLPIVSTRVAGSTLLVKDGVNGFLVPPNDATALSKALVQCIGHPDDLFRLGNAARSTVVDEFSSAKMASATEAVFATVYRQQCTHSARTIHAE